MKNYNVAAISPLLSSAKTALIVVPQISVDSIGSALGLALSLKQKNINAKVFSPQKTDQNYSKLSGLELLGDSFSGSDLVISLTYPLDQIDQVSYNDDGGKLNLVVKTKPSGPQVDNSQIAINNQSAVADICFMLGDESSLGLNSSIVNRGNWVFISPVNVVKTWAKASIIDPDAPYSEIFTFLLPMLGLNLNADIGKDLLIGLRVATQSFSVNVSPESFEAGAICLRATQPEMPAAPGNGLSSQPVVNPTPIEAVESKPNFNSGGSSTPIPTA